MIGKVAIPKVDANIEEITITGWLKREGDRVRKGEPLVELTTEKATFEMESPYSGIVRRLLADEKSVLPVGYVIALIGDAQGALPDVSARNQRILADYARVNRASAAPPAVPRAAVAEAGGQTAGLAEAVRATPAARRLAKEKGIDLADVKKALAVDVINEGAILKYLERNRP